jgi:hypothetical protein
VHMPVIERCARERYGQRGVVSARGVVFDRAVDC